MSLAKSVATSIAKKKPDRVQASIQRIDQCEAFAEGDGVYLLSRVLESIAHSEACGHPIAGLTFNKVVETLLDVVASVKEFEEIIHKIKLESRSRPAFPSTATQSPTKLRITW